LTVVIVSVPDMCCRHDVRAVTGRLRDLDGVETVQADAGAAVVVVRGTVSEETVRHALAQIGFRTSRSG
jgi:copper chaperone CopZ